MCRQCYVEESKRLSILIRCGICHVGGEERADGQSGESSGDGMNSERGMLKTKLVHQINVRDMQKLKVTESAYAELESEAISFLNEMKTLGLALMLDDFGSGMSSFSTLENFVFCIIKIDMGFISQIGKGGKAGSIIKHIIGLSHDVGAKGVAEAEFAELGSAMSASHFEIDCLLTLHIAASSS